MLKDYLIEIKCLIVRHCFLQLLNRQFRYHFYKFVAAFLRSKYW